jgi:hypothetical protein
MELTKSTIINNFEWVLAQQTAVDMLKLAGLYEKILEITEELRDLDIPAIDITPEELMNDNHKGSIYNSVYRLFQQLNSIQTNKLTYLPNLVGVYLLIRSKNI